MKKIILATNNKHKVEEFRRIFKRYQFLTLKEIGFNETIVEDGLTFQDNALIKAQAVMKYVKEKTNLELAVLADDSGLCVKAINYEPGINSARYSGGNDEDNRQKLLNNLTTIQDRTAYFQCFLALIMPDGTEILGDGKTYGTITKNKIGNDSFGYDCIFWSTELGKTFGQALPEEKDKVSHRAKASKEIIKYLDSINYIGTDDEEEY